MTETTASWTRPVALPTYPDLAGKVGVVTGAAQGMGARFVRGLLDQGMHVVALDLPGEALKCAATAYRTSARVTHREADVTSLGTLSELIDEVHAEFGTIDLWVNNAGVFPGSDVLQTLPAEWDLVQDVNVKGVFFASQAVARKMEATGGSIVNMASIASQKVLPGRASYCASKAAVEHLTRSLAVELGPLGIRVNAIAPGQIETGMTEWLRADASAASAAIERIPLRRFGTTDDVIGALLFLASDSARYITGHTLGVDGGVRFI